MSGHTTGLNKLVDQLAEEITVIKERKRKRTAEENKRFIHSLTKILTDVWEGTGPHMPHPMKRMNSETYKLGC